MFQCLNKTIDKLSEFLAPRKGLLLLIGMFLYGKLRSTISPGWLGEGK
jgi:hypothetical protein